MGGSTVNNWSWGRPGTRQSPGGQLVRVFDWYSENPDLNIPA